MQEVSVLIPLNGWYIGSLELNPETEHRSWLLSSGAQSAALGKSLLHGQVTYMWTDIFLSPRVPLKYRSASVPSGRTMCKQCQDTGISTKVRT